MLLDCYLSSRTLTIDASSNLVGSSIKFDDSIGVMDVTAV
jgi:hypothetical protein